MRMFSSQRRRRGYGRASFSRSPLTGGRYQGPAVETGSSQGGGHPSFTGIAPGWLADPFARHDQRYWSGTEWTDHVADNGVPGTDPPPRGAG